MKIARIRVPPDFESEASLLARIAENYGYKVEVKVDREARGIVVELDGLRFDNPDDAARHIAWEYLKKVFGSKGE
ncbi:MAG: hypothetical protein F7B17_01305 [Desulfurococcales archaeon]|nr:hypothetical protein [Desulfurococcales archaeon]